MSDEIILDTKIYNIKNWTLASKVGLENFNKKKVGLEKPINDLKSETQIFLEV